MTEERGEVTTSPYTARVIRGNVDVLIVMTRVENCVVRMCPIRTWFRHSAGGHTAPKSTG